MSAIAGLFRFDGSPSVEMECRAMLDAQCAFGPDDRSSAILQECAAGRALYRTLPEDRFDRQPLLGGDGKLLLVADVRIDNRDELLRALGREGAGATLSDSDILLAGFERWSEGVLDRLAGDYAFAVWDASARRLILARDPLGERPLLYHRGRDYFAFASMPHGLHALPDVDRRPNLSQAAAFAADLFPSGSATYWERIERVETGHVVTVTQLGLTSRRYWNPRRTELRLPSDGQYVEAFREQLDRATRPRLRRLGGMVASHLSSGYDSSAVAATAARLLDPERLLAFTSAPRAGFDGPVPRGRVADESSVAAAVAQMHPNMEHRVIRPEGRSPLAALDRLHPLVGQPAGHLCNTVWATAINEAAQAAGATVLLHGQSGNFTVSNGGRNNLADLLREGHWLDWWREARAMVRRGPIRWRGVLDNSLGPWAPLLLYRVLRRRFLHSSDRAAEGLVRPEWHAEINRRAATLGRDPRPPRDSFALSIRLLQGDDPGAFRKATLARYGLDQRDPTGDRRLIEFCLSLPVNQLIRNGERRPLARGALADRLPPLLLDQERRGYQAADWYEQIGPEQVRQAVRRLGRSEAASTVIDFAAVEKLTGSWPTGNWDQQWVITDYRAGLLRALSTAHFLSVADA